jgi:hypothetical protein
MHFRNVYNEHIHFKPPVQGAIQAIPQPFPGEKATVLVE